MPVGCKPVRKSLGGHGPWESTVLLGPDLGPALSGEKTLSCRGHMDQWKWKMPLSRSWPAPEVVSSGGRQGLAG